VLASHLSALEVIIRSFCKGTEYVIPNFVVMFSGELTIHRSPVPTAGLAPHFTTQSITTILYLIQSDGKRSMPILDSSAM
jgi:hypothetical protein